MNVLKSLFPKACWNNAGAGGVGAGGLGGPGGPGTGPAGNAGDAGYGWGGSGNIGAGVQTPAGVGGYGGIQGGFGGPVTSTYGNVKGTFTPTGTPQANAAKAAAEAAAREAARRVSVSPLPAPVRRQQVITQPPSQPLPSQQIVPVLAETAQMYGPNAIGSAPVTAAATNSTTGLAAAGLLADRAQDSAAPATARPSGGYGSRQGPGGIAADGPTGLAGQFASGNVNTATGGFGPGGAGGIAPGNASGYGAGLNAGLVGGGFGPGGQGGLVGGPAAPGSFGNQSVARGGKSDRTQSIGGNASLGMSPSNVISGFQDPSTNATSVVGAPASGQLSYGGAVNQANVDVNNSILGRVINTMQEAGLPAPIGLLPSQSQLAQQALQADMNDFGTVDVPYNQQESEPVELTVIPDPDAQRAQPVSLADSVTRADVDTADRLSEPATTPQQRAAQEQALQQALQRGVLQQADANTFDRVGNMETVPATANQSIAGDTGVLSSIFSDALNVNNPFGTASPAPNNQLSSVQFGLNQNRAAVAAGVRNPAEQLQQQQRSNELRGMLQSVEPTTIDTKIPTDIDAGLRAPDETGMAIAELLPSDVGQDSEFVTGVRQIEDKYGFPAGALFAVMEFETGGSFSPSQKTRAPGGSATGLIQFIEKTARGLGTSTAELSKMTRAEQLEYVDKYLAQFADRLGQDMTIEDAYMAILYPRAIGKPNDYAVFSRSRNRKQYNANKGLDRNRDGVVTKAEAARKVTQNFQKYAEYLGQRGGDEGETALTDEEAQAIRDLQVPEGEFGSVTADFKTDETIDATTLLEKIRGGEMPSVSEIISTFGVGNALGLLSLFFGGGSPGQTGYNGNRPPEERQVGPQSIRDIIFGTPEGGNDNQGGGGVPNNRNYQWTPPGLLSRPYLNPYGTRL